MRTEKVDVVVYKYRPAIMVTSLAVHTAAYVSLWVLGGWYCVAVLGAAHVSTFVLHQLNSSLQEGEPR